jgi:hypothetical protein
VPIRTICSPNRGSCQRGFMWTISICDQRCGGSNRRVVFCW